MIATRPELEFYGSSALGLLKDGTVKVKIYKEYSLASVAEAHKELEGRKTTGKLLIKF